MTSQSTAKQERVIEAVRHGLEGDSAIEFVRQSGYAITAAGIARHLKKLGGRKQILDLISQGLSNVEILETCLPQSDTEELRKTPPAQGDLFGTAHSATSPAVPFDRAHTPVYETTKLTIRVPTDLYEALRLASRAEGKSQNQLIVEILTQVLSQLPRDLPEED